MVARWRPVPPFAHRTGPLAVRALLCTRVPSMRARCIRRLLTGDFLVLLLVVVMVLVLVLVLVLILVQVLVALAPQLRWQGSPQQAPLAQARADQDPARHSASSSLSRPKCMICYGECW
eukprot:Rmarinus@m.16359